MMNPNHRQSLEILEKNLDITFNNKELLLEALLHKSYRNEHKKEIRSNERLEYLGDAVLELIISEYFYLKYPDRTEGDLTDFRSSLVKGSNLSKVGKKLKLGDFLLLGKGEIINEGFNNPNILENAVESIVWAIYLDKWLQEAKKFIYKYIIPLFKEIKEKNLHVDYKTLLQNIIQAEQNVTPHYQVIEEFWPDHTKEFKVGVFVGKKLIWTGIGTSKQKAELQTAQNVCLQNNWDLVYYEKINKTASAK